MYTCRDSSCKRCKVAPWEKEVPHEGHHDRGKRDLFPVWLDEDGMVRGRRLPRSLSKSKKKARVQALIDQLGLRFAASTVIRDEGHREVSGCEWRRDSIGIDIIHDPIVLFLDEPTSGLDSTSAFMVVKVLQRIALSGSIVIMSVHQPSYRILSLLDRLLFLSHDNTVFSGSPTTLHPFFSKLALDLIRELEQEPGATKSLVDFNKSWQMKISNQAEGPKPKVSVSLKEAIGASISRRKLVLGEDESGKSLKSTVASFANPFWKEMFVIGKRSLTNSRRMPELFGIRLGAVLVTGSILATIFLPKIN
ncbi:hypothetical protein Fmac_022010 [Flemingia macrophylla]|uniref:ABC transporter domain-containing protein n=1 Tax=Flemingia macrophylla TaxID=520843 RepID=A0ABD1LYI4_9FABA